MGEEVLLASNGNCSLPSTDRATEVEVQEIQRLVGRCNSEGGGSICELLLLRSEGAIWR